MVVKSKGNATPYFREIYVLGWWNIIPFGQILLMEEILLHHLGCKQKNLVNNSR